MVAPDLIGCLLIKRTSKLNYLWGVIVETEAYSQSEASCHGYNNKKTNRNKTLFGAPGRFYICKTYGAYFCVNVVTDKNNWANGVLLRALAMPGENERIASGPGLLAKRFGINQSHDNSLINIENGLWIAKSSENIKMQKIMRTTRIGISKEKELRWRWYLQSSRSVSKRAKGDHSPSQRNSWQPTFSENQ